MTEQKPPLKVILVWHTANAEAMTLGTELHGQLASSVSDVMRPGLGMDVRMLPLQAGMDYAALQPEMDGYFQHFERVGVFALLDASFKNDAPALAFVKGLMQACANTQDMHRFFPISLEDAAFGLDNEIGDLNFIRLQLVEAPLRDENITGRVCHELCRMLTDFPRSDAEGAANRLPPVKLFISHTKKDGGLRIAKEIARYYATEPPFKTFFDASEIPAGEPFPDVIDESVKESTILVLQSDLYSTRYWCLEEVLRAKEYDRPLVGIYCLDQGEQRSFPYLGNIPTLSWKDATGVDAMMAQITRSVARETLKFLYFRKLASYSLKVTEAALRQAGVVVSARPPEMAVLARIKASSPQQRTYLYPDPPVSANEEKFILTAFPEFKLSTLSKFSLPAPQPAVGPAEASSATAGDGPDMLDDVLTDDTDSDETARSFGGEDDVPTDKPGKKKNPSKKKRGKPRMEETGKEDTPAWQTATKPQVHDHQVGLSISSAEDMAALGRMDTDVDHALNHFMRDFLADGAEVIYGGDYRTGGFSERIQDLVRTYSPGSMEAEHQPLQSYLAWPWEKAPGDELVEELKRFVSFHKTPLPDDLANLPPAAPGSAEEQYRLARALSHNRAVLNARATLRVMLGGRLSGYKGFLPGVLEEFLLAVEKGVPIYMVGAYGGVSRQIIHCLRGGEPTLLLEKMAAQQAAQPELMAFYQAALKAKPQLHPLGDIRPEAVGKRLKELAAKGITQVLRNDLTEAENARLFDATHPADMVVLVRKGMK